jgi:predicted PurR-regulated permease PerM
LSISAAIALLLLFLVREILFPFILALVVAYVLTPLVAMLERRRVPRSAAIISIYTVLLGVISVGTVLAAPRLYQECLLIMKEVPNQVRHFATDKLPELEARLNGVLGEGAHASEQTPPPLLLVEPGENGTFRVQMPSQLEVLREDEEFWRISSPSGQAKLEPSHLLDNALAQTFDYIKRNVLQVLKIAKAVVSSTTRAMILGFATLACAAYIMYTRDQIWGFIRSLVPRDKWGSFDRLITRIDQGLAGVIRGQLLICVVNGVLSGIGFWLFGLKYWPVLSLIAAGLSIIPIFGAFLSTVPAVLIGLTQDIWIAIWVTVWIIGIHQLEANLLNPKIIGDAAKLHPVLVVLSLVAGEHFYGLAGALLAVPTLSLLQSFFNHFRFELMPPPTGLTPVPSEGPPAEPPEDPADASVGADKTAS